MRLNAFEEPEHAAHGSPDAAYDALAQARLARVEPAFGRAGETAAETLSLC